jgi:hypothetical protein
MKHIMYQITAMLKAKSTTLLCVRGERKIYSVKPTAAFKREFFVFGRGWVFPLNAEFEFMEKSKLTGNPYDTGYVVVDKRKA